MTGDERELKPRLPAELAENGENLHYLITAEGACDAPTKMRLDDVTSG